MFSVLFKNSLGTLAILLLMLAFIAPEVYFGTAQPQAQAQSAIDFTGDDEEEEEGDKDDGDVVNEGFHETVLNLVRNEIRESKDLRAGQKRRMLRRLNRPWVATRITDYVTLKSMEAGAIEVNSLDVFESTGEPFTIDLDQIIEIIEAILPIIIQLLSLFG